MATRAEDYTVGWICAVMPEMVAACELLDEEYTKDRVPKVDIQRDSNSYRFGRMHDHDAVIACLPTGRYGTTSAAIVAERMRSSFPAIRLGLMVGIAGGAPSQRHDIRLGDVVVSVPTSTRGGVLQYDFGKLINHQTIEVTGHLAPPPEILLNAVASLRADYERKGHAIAEVVSKMIAKNERIYAKYSYPGAEKDRLYETLDGQELLIERKKRGIDEDDPVIHYGLIASANHLMKDGKSRDALIAKYEDVLCFEMEAAGLMNNFPCLIIRGICDYSDRHKNDEWQGYAAATAAAYAKELLGNIPGKRIESLSSSIGITSIAITGNLSQEEGIVDSMRHLATSPRDKQDIKDRITPSTSRYMIGSLPDQGFVGRDSQLAELEQKCFVDKQGRNFAVYGLGGVGKTQLVRAFCQVIKARYPRYSIFWVSALSSARFRQDYTKLAGICGLPSEDSKEDVFSLVKNHLSSDAAGNWMLVIDNADDETILFADDDDGNEDGGIFDTLPQSMNGITLFTTRYKHVANELAGGNIISLEEMSLKEATAFLKASLTGDSLVQDEILVKRFLEELAYLPLAIAQACSFIVKKSITISMYLYLLLDTEESMIKLLNHEFRNDMRNRKSNNAVAKTWLVSFQQIEKFEPGAAELLFFIACIEHNNIPSSIFPPTALGSNRTSFVEPVGTLISYSFLSKHGVSELGDSDVYDMHRLVHRALRIWMTDTNILDTWRNKVISRLGEVFPSYKWDNHMILFREYTPHAIRVLLDTEQLTTDARANLCLSLAMCIREDGRSSEAVRWMKECVLWRDQSLPEEDEDRITAQHELGAAYISNGDFKEAVQILEKAAAVAARELPEEDLRRLRSQRVLAQAYVENGQIQAGIGILEKLVIISGRTLSEDNSDRSMIQNALAHAYLSNDQLKEAVELLENLVIVRETTLPEDSPRRLWAEGTLAIAYLKLGRVGKAIKMLEKLVTMAERVLKEDNLYRLRFEIALAESYWISGQHERAMSLKQRVVPIIRNSFPVDHPPRLALERVIAQWEDQPWGGEWQLIFLM